MRFWKYVKDIIQNSSQEEQQEQSEQQGDKPEEQSSKGDEQKEEQQEESEQQGDKPEEQSSKSDEQKEEQQEESEQQGDKPEEQSSKGDEQKEEQQEESEQQGDKPEEESSKGDEQKEEQQEESEQQGDKSEEKNSKSDEQREEQQEESEQQGDKSEEESSKSDEQREEQQEESEQQGDKPEEESSKSDEQREEQQEESEQQEKEPEEQSSKSGEQKEEQQEENESEESLNESPNDNLEVKKEKISQLRDILKEYADKKHQDEEKLKKDRIHLHEEKKEITESLEEQYELSEQTNNFLNLLSELPSFKDRKRSPGYSIDTEGYTEIPDSMIRTLLTKFLNQRFCKHSTDLNIRSNSLEKAIGFYKWEVKDVITHLETHQITKVFDDKYGYQYANGKNENVPLSFYFDMSCSMNKYTNMLSVIAIELLKKGVKVLIGFNERVNVQIESIKKNIDVLELASVLKSAGYSSENGNLKKDDRVVYKYINRNLDNYLLSKKAEKCVVFSDFDPLDEVVNLSQKTEVYWFCFESSFDKKDLKYYNGFIYKVKNAKDIASGLIKVNEKRFETLCYTDNPKSLQRKLGR